MKESGTSFVHLHVHTEYSLKEAVCRLEDMMKKAKSWNMDALAITDKGAIHGAIRFHELAEQHGIHPIIGCEMTVGDAGESLIVLAATNRGYEQIIEHLNSGSFHSPASHGDIIALSGGRTGTIHRLIASGRMDQAEKQALQYVKWFGKENFYLEVQHHGFPDDDVWMERTVQLSRRTKIPIVATHDVHYLVPEDASLLHMLQHGKMKERPDLPTTTGPFYFPSPLEMKVKFRHLPDALANTVQIAQRCRFRLESGEYRLPTFPVSQEGSVDGHSRPLSESGNMDAAKPQRSSDDVLLHLCREGLQNHSDSSSFKDTEPQRIAERMNRELEVITKRGLSEPRKSEVKEALPILLRQIELIRPEVIVCLGSIAVQAVFDQKAKITEIRGEWLEKDWIRIMPTYHPSAVFRDESKRDLLKQDLYAVRAALKLLGA